MPCLLTLTLLCRSPPFPLPLSPLYQLPFLGILHFSSCPFSGPKILADRIKNNYVFAAGKCAVAIQTHTYLLYIVCRQTIQLCVCMSEMTTQSQVAEIFTTFLSATETKTYEKCYENVALCLANPAPVYLPIPPTTSHLVTSRTSRQPYTNPNPQ